MKKVGVGTLLLAISVFAVLLSYNNCGKSPLLYEELQMASVNSLCAQSLYKTFENGYYPYLRRYCSSCHTESGQGNGAFASADHAAAFNSFMGKVNALGLKGIQSKLASGHSNIYSANPNASSEFDSLKTDFDLDLVSYLNCQSETGPMQQLETAPNKMEATPASKTLQFRLDNIVPQGESFDAVISLKVALVVDSGGKTLGYKFSQPAMSYGNPLPGATGRNLFLEGFKLKLNGSIIPVTAYTNINAILTPGETRNSLVYGTNAPFLSMTNADINDQLSLSISSIAYTNQTEQVIAKPTPQAPAERTNFEKITYKDLMGLTANTSSAVFKNRCIGCHGANNGSRDFSTYAKATATKFVIKPTTGNKDTRMQSPIYARCFSGSMPTNGALSEAELNKIGDWILNGAPEM